MKRLIAFLFFAAIPALGQIGQTPGLNVPGAASVNGQPISPSSVTTGTVSAGAAVAAGATTTTLTNPGIWTGGGVSTSYGAVQSLVNGASMSMWAAGAQPSQDALVGAEIVPSNSTDIQADGVTGMVDNYTTAPGGSGGTNAVGIYGQARAFASGGYIWGADFVTETESGVNNTVSQGIEIDMDTKGTGATVNGISITAPFWQYTPNYATGVGVFRPTYASTSGTWNVAFSSGEGAAASALYVGTYLPAGVASSASQYLVFGSRNAAGTELSSTIQADLNGNLNLNPYTSGYVSMPIANVGALDTTTAYIATSANLGTVGTVSYLNVSDGGAKTNTSELVSSFFGSNEVLASNPFGMTTSIVGAASLGSRVAYLQTQDVGAFYGGTLALQPHNGGISLNGTAPCGAGVTCAYGAIANTQGTILPSTVAGYTGSTAGYVELVLTGTTATITGTALTATCDSGTATVTDAVVGHPVAVSSTIGADVGGAFNLRASVTATNTVTVYVCGTGTPASLAYNVTVF